jgi:hypothetical protein
MAKCPACGFVAVAVNSIKPEAGELRELKPKPKQKKIEWHPDEKKWFYAELKAYGRSKGYNPHWADNQYRAKFGVWPNAYKGIAPASRISDETKSWIKSRQIAYAQAKAKARREMAV